MNSRWQNFVQKNWQSRPASERRTLVIGSWVLSPLIFYFLLWQPAHQAVQKLNVNLPILRAQSVKLHEQRAEVEALRHRPQPATLETSALKNAVEQSATTHGIRSALSVIENQAPNAVRIASDGISFEKWLNWQRELQKEQQVRIDSVALTALPQAGLIKLNATLTASAEK